jgi:arylsulfatase A-like enzyme
MAEALKFIRKNKGGPFFCYLPWTIPHASMHVPERYTAPFRKKFAKYENTIGRYKGPKVKNPVAAFAGMMVKMDEGVGLVTSLLRELGIEKNTVVLFTSDNGPHREGGHRPDVFDSNGPLSGYKRDVTEGGIRVPLIASWPGRIKPGTTTNHISAHWDFLPTACALAGIKAPRKIDGISFLPTLLGKTEDQRQHEYLYWEFFEQGGKRAARFGKWKAIQRNLKKNLNSPIQLFDLEADIAEKKNLAGKHPELVKQAREIFAEAHTPSKRWGDLSKSSRSTGKR